jgi:hypothetical protein
MDESLLELLKPWLVSLKSNEVTDWPNAPGNLKINRIGSTIRPTSNKSVRASQM